MKKKMKILLVEPICCEALIALRSKFELFVEILPNKTRLLRVIEDKEIVILKSRIELDKEVISAAKHLKLVVMAGIGLDHICLDELKRREIAWFNIPDLSARSVAELTLGLTLSLARNICLADSWLRNDEFRPLRRPELIGITLQNKLLGIVGYGKTGQETASLAKCFGMKVQVYMRNVENQILEENITPVTFQHLLKTSDIISIHVPLTNETRGLFSKLEFELMLETALLINTSRGGIINEKDLYQALKSKTIAGAAIDVFEQKEPYAPLLELDNLVITPHIGAMTQETQEQIGRQIVKKIFEFFQ